MLRRYFVFCILFFCMFAAKAQNVSVKVNVPNQIVVNQRFQISFTIYNASPDSFRMPKMKHIKLVSGPSKSTQTNTQIVGNKMVVTRSTSLSYVAIADKAGDLELPAANIWSGGKHYQSDPITINVQKANSEKEKSSQQKQKENQKIPEASATEVAGSDMFIVTEWEDKEGVYAQNSNVFVIKLYYKNNVYGWHNLVFPKIKSSTVTDAQLQRGQIYGKTRVNGDIYNTVVIAKKDIKPTKTGKLRIDNGSIDVIVNIPNRNDFWGGYHQVEKTLVIPGKVVEVKASDEKPKEEKNVPMQERWNL